MKWFSVISYVMRIAVIIGWGWQIIRTTPMALGDKIGNNNQLVGLYFIKFITVRELTIIPIQITRWWFVSRLKKYDKGLEDEVASSRLAASHVEVVAAGPSGPTPEELAAAATAAAAAAAALALAQAALEAKQA